MKTIISALLALSVLSGMAASAYAFDAKTFFQQEDRWSR
jgi:hypothetical protein